MYLLASLNIHFDYLSLTRPDGGGDGGQDKEPPDKFRLSVPLWLVGHWLTSDDTFV